MISHQVLTRSSVGASTVKAIESYYKDSKDDYYSKDNQPSLWQGKLAEELGLIGEVKKENFIQLMSGISPDNKLLRQNKYKNKNADERLAIDLTFSAPKSISIESLVNGNIGVLKAHEDAVTRTLELIEQRANTRLKKDGVSKTVNTGNLAIGKFRHETNRNNDPQLHTHAVILNITKRDDGEYRALHNDSIIKSTKEFTKIYQGYLAKELKEQGFKLRITKDGFELAHINDNQIQAFSSRSKEVEKALSEIGLTRETATTAEKQKATLSTRQKKTEKDIVQTRNQWVKNAKEVGIKPFYVSKEIIITPKQTKLDAFENAFNKDNELESKPINLTQSEYLHEQSGSDPRSFDFSRATGRSENGSERGTDFSRGLADFIESSRHGKSKEEGREASRGGGKANFTGFSQEGIVTRNQAGFNEQSFNKNFGHFNSGQISENGIEESSISSGRNSSTNIGELDSTGRKDFSYSVRTMPSFTMADTGRFNTMLLPVDQKVFFHNEGTSFIAGLSGSEDSFRSNAGSVSKTEADKDDNHESLDDIFTYHLIDDSMREKWKDRLEPITEDDLNNEVIYFENKEQLKEFVIEHLTDKNNVIHKKELEKQLLDKGLGLISFDDVENIVNEMVLDNQLLVTDQLYNLNGELLTEKGIINKLELPIGDYNLEKILNNNKIEKMDAVYTTPEAYKRDHHILSMLDYAKDKNTPAYKVEDAKELLEKTTLNDGQKRCAEMVLTAKDSLLGIQGYAGTGKSYMLVQTKEILEKSGKEMHFFAPYASQVKSLKKDGLEANTLAKFLKSKSLHKKLNENSVLVIDESGVINSKQMRELLGLRQSIGCQIVLLGDTAQTKAVEAGSPFELLQQNGLKIEKMTDIQRQKKEDLKQAVVFAVNDKMDESVKNLKDLYEIKNTDARHDEIVKTYMALSEQDRADTLIVAGTNEDRASINERVRDQLGIKGKGIEFISLNDSKMTEAERKLTFFYAEGDVVKFGKDNNKSGIEKDIPYTVVGLNHAKNKLTLKDSNDNEIEVNPKGKNISVFKEIKIEMSKGDKIRITKTENNKELATGDLFEIESISKDTGSVIGKDSYGKLHTFNIDEKHHITHAYAMTVHASQGLTYNNVIADLNTKSLTLSKETFYVAISRAKYNAFVFTEDKKQLPEAILRSSSKSNAISLFNDNINSDIIKTDSIDNSSLINNTMNRGDKMENENLEFKKDFDEMSKSFSDNPNYYDNKVSDLIEFISENKDYELSELKFYGDNYYVGISNDEGLGAYNLSLKISKEGEEKTLHVSNEEVYIENLYDKSRVEFDYLNPDFKDIVSNSFILDNKNKDLSYQTGHRPEQTQAYASDITLNGELLPDEFYENPQYYYNFKDKDLGQAYKESFEALDKVKGNPEAEITIYRAGETNEINYGDWVTLSKSYAVEHAETYKENNFEGLVNMQVTEMTVKASHVQFAGDDICEFGYFADGLEHAKNLETKNVIYMTNEELSEMNTIDKIDLNSLDNTDLAKSVIQQIGQDKFADVVLEISNNQKDSNYAEAELLKGEFVNNNEINFDQTHSIVINNFDEIMTRLNEESKAENYTNVHHYISDMVTEKMFEGESISTQQVIDALENKDFDNPKNITLIDVMGRDAIEKTLSEVAQNYIDQQATESIELSSDIKEYSTIEALIDDINRKGGETNLINKQQMETINHINQLTKDNNKVYFSEVTVISDRLMFQMAHNQNYESLHSIDIVKDGSLEVMDQKDGIIQYHSSQEDIANAIGTIHQNIDNVDRVQVAKASLEQQLQEAGYKVYEQTKLADDQYMGDVEYQVLVAENENNTYAIYHGINEKNELTFDLQSQRFTSEHREKHTFSISENEIKNGFELKPENFKYHLEAKDVINGTETKHYSNNLNDIDHSQVKHISHDQNLTFKAEGKEIYSRINDFETGNRQFKANDTTEFHKENPKVIENFVKENSYYKVEMKTDMDRQDQNKQLDNKQGKSKQDGLEM